MKLRNGLGPMPTGNRVRQSQPSYVERGQRLLQMGEVKLDVAVIDGGLRGLIIAPVWRLSGR